jgi:hypothetical protein
LNLLLFHFHLRLIAFAIAAVGRPNTFSSRGSCSTQGIRRA